MGVKVPRPFNPVFTTPARSSIPLPLRTLDKKLPEMKILSRGGRSFIRALSQCSEASPVPTGSAYR
jgi:hypothetical protein